jgi:hypothetical protein
VLVPRELALADGLSIATDAPPVVLPGDTGTGGGSSIAGGTSAPITGPPPARLASAQRVPRSAVCSWCGGAGGAAGAQASARFGRRRLRLRLARIGARPLGRRRGALAQTTVHAADQLERLAQEVVAGSGEVVRVTGHGQLCFRVADVAGGDQRNQGAIPPRCTPAGSLIYTAIRGSARVSFGVPASRRPLQHPHQCRSMTSFRSLSTSTFG